MNFKNKNVGTALILSLYAAAVSPSGAAIAAEDSEAMKKADAMYARMTEKSTKQVAAAFREVIRVEPDNAKAHQRLGAVLASMDQYDTAILECKQSMKLDPKGHLPHVILGQIYANQGKMPEAAREFERAVALKPDSFRSWMDLGLANAKLNKIDDAIKAYTKASELKDKDPMPHMNLGVLFDSKGDFKKAIDEGNLAVKLDGSKNPLILMNLGNIYADAKEDDKAIEAYKGSLRLDRSPLAHCGLGWVYERKGDLTAAVKEQKIAMKMAPEYPRPVYRHASILAAQGKVKEAEVEYKRALNLKAKDPMAIVEYSNFLKSQNREAEAKKLLQSAQIAKEGNSKAGN